MSVYDPDYIDDRACREARRIEREITDELNWRMQREVQETRDLLIRIKDLTSLIEEIKKD